MNSNPDVLMVTEKLAKDLNFPYIKEVAERAAMTDKEVLMELASRNWHSSGDDNKDSSVMLAVILDFYLKELTVHTAIEKGVHLFNTIRTDKLDEIKILSWRDVFDTNKGRYDISTANIAAKQAGYDKFCWNGRVLTVDENIDLGTLEELGLK